VNDDAHLGNTLVRGPSSSGVMLGIKSDVFH
jgi:hypothetical protein